MMRIKSVHELEIENGLILTNEPTTELNFEKRLQKLKGQGPSESKKCKYCEKEIKLEPTGKKPKYCNEKCQKLDESESARFLWRRQELNRQEIQMRVDKLRVKAYVFKHRNDKPKAS